MLASLRELDDNTTHSYFVPLFDPGQPVTFQPSSADHEAGYFDLAACGDVTVCDLSGVERFLVWAVRWAASRHDEPSFAAMCLQDSFDRAGIGDALPVFRRFVSIVHGEPAYCPAASRLGCWRLNMIEAHTLHALASLQKDRFGDAWRTLSRICPRIDAARAMLLLGEIADSLTAVGAQVRPWRRPAQSDAHARGTRAQGGTAPR